VKTKGCCLKCRIVSNFKEASSKRTQKLQSLGLITLGQNKTKMTRQRLEKFQRLQYQYSISRSGLFRKAVTSELEKRFDKKKQSLRKQCSTRIHFFSLA